MTLTYITISAFVIVLGVLIISPKFRKQNYLLKVIKENYTKTHMLALEQAGRL